jgi:hypothetical protein
MEVISTYNVNDFIDYFTNNHNCLTTSEKTVVEHIQDYFDGVDAEKVDLITKSVKLHNLTVVESSSGNFNAYFKYVSFPFRNSRHIAFHELGHVVDFISIESIQIPIGSNGCKKKYKFRDYSNEIKLSTGKSLDKTVKEETKTVANELSNYLLTMLRQELSRQFSQEVIDEYIFSGKIFIEQRRAKIKLSHSKKKCQYERQLALDNYNKIEKIIARNNNFKEVRKLVYKSKVYLEFCDKYGFLSDMISGCIDDLKYILPGHSRTYLADKHYGSEFFANFFSDECTNNFESIAIVRKFLPLSVQAYYELLFFIKTENKSVVQDANKT